MYDSKAVNFNEKKFTLGYTQMSAGQTRRPVRNISVWKPEAKVPSCPNYSFIYEIIV